MRFRLFTLLAAVTVLATYFGLLVAGSITALVLFFAGLSAFTPAALIAGAVFGRERLQAFCIAGLAAGTMPVLMATGNFLECARQGLGWLGAQPGIYRDYTAALRTGAHVALLAPLVVIAVGGFIGVRMRRAFLTTSPPSS